MPSEPRKRVKRVTRRTSRKAAGPAITPCVVGIGASAGGFEAIRKLLSTMPANGRLAFVVVQHLDPRHKSMAAELLGPRTALTVVEAANGQQVEADHVYMVPAACEVAVAGGLLRLTPRIETEKPHLPVDRLFHALAEGLRERAIGVVLSGTGSDGSLGALHIAAEGGIVLVQDPATARYDGMPRSVITTGAASDVLPVEAMPDVLVGYSRHPYVLGEAVPASDEATSETAALRTILAALRKARGQSFQGYKPATLLRRIRRRMGLRRITDIGEYSRLASRDDAELGGLYKDMLIGVTQFFRDPEAWAVLARDVIGPLIRAKTDEEPVRVWVAGAATGEEAYTVAMLLLEARRELGRQCPIRVFATDANPDAIAFARVGRYPAGIAAQLSPGRLQEFFSLDARDNAYQVRPELRDCVTFGVQDLASDPPFSRMDLICCRNVLIYLQPPVQADLMRVFNFALQPGGFLFLGTAESAHEGDGRFLCRSQKWKIYQRTAATPTAHRVRLREGRPSESRPAEATPAGAGAGRAAILPDLVQRLLLQRFGAAAAIVDAHNQILHFAGPTDRFLGPPKGPPTQDILALARDGLRSRLRNALAVAAESGADARIDNARVREGREYRPVHITVMPVRDPVVSSYGRLFLVIFADEPARAPVAAPSATVRRLEDELQLTRDDLESTIDDLQASNLELKFSNEAVTAANEELQAMNEELESSKEELQSLNEELQTSNQQLADKVAELATANSDLQNLFQSSEIGTIRLDAQMNVRWFTSAATVAMNLRPDDIGRPITDLASALGGEPLLDRARKVLEHLAPVQDEVQARDGRWFMRRVVPYRVDSGRVDGVIVTLTDITETKRTADAALAEKEAFAATLEQRVEERTRELGALAGALSLAEDRERQSVAADLHDDLAQLLSLIKLKLVGLGALRGQAGTPAALEEISRLVDDADSRIRRLSSQLSNPVLHQLGLVAALSALSDEMRRDYHLHVILHDDGIEKRLEPPVSVIVFRAVRELLINVAKHAGTLTSQVRCEVDCHKDGQKLVVVVSDDGRGFEPRDLEAKDKGRNGLGLPLIRERLRFIGGSFDIVSKPGDGVEATISVPLNERAAGGSPP